MDLAKSNPSTFHLGASGKRLQDLSAAELAGAVARGELQCEEVAEAFLQRAATLGPDNCVFITLTRERALRRAAELDSLTSRDEPMPPLAGVPVAVKDLIDVAGVVTTGGSKVLADNIAAHDAEVVKRLERAGCLVIGKTNLHEFAYGATGENPTYGTPTNVYDSGRLACGSSSGSAVAVALGLATLALGTDTGGSTRVPAVMNGLVGLKPTFGLLPTTGVLPYCWSLDHVGLMARTALDCELLLQACDPEFATRGTLRNYVSEQITSGLRIGVPSPWLADRVDPEIRAKTAQVIDRLCSEGASVIEVCLPDLQTSRSVSLIIQMPEALSFHARYLPEREHLYGADFRAGLALGQFLLAEHYVRAKRMAVTMRAEVDELFDIVDVILTPATPVIAPGIGLAEVITEGHAEPVGNAVTRFTSLFNVTGHPAIVVPCAMHSLGLPMGIQLVGGPFQEGLLLALAARIQSMDEFSILPVNSHS
jgi:aspartyl-tRNA(Asn)/glutamyl-tRNA(Gln) amidotransferase subunit A